MKSILVLCTGNSCRSQMAEAYLRKFANGKADVKSAGIEAHGLNARAVKVMLEDGIDISTHTSNTIDEYIDTRFDYVLTVCDNAKENCPTFPQQTAQFHFNFPDPAKASGSEEEILTQFRTVRDQIRDYSQRFVSDLQLS